MNIKTATVAAFALCVLSLLLQSWYLPTLHHKGLTTPISLSACDTVPLIVSDNNFVGISIDTPQYRLDVNGLSQGNPIRLQGLLLGSTADSLISSQNGVLKRIAPIGGIVDSLLQGVTGNFGNVAYVSKNGNNSTGVIGNRNKPFKDPIAARKALESKNINDGLIEVFPATYLVADTDTATFQMTQAGITPDVFVLVDATQAQSKENWTLSPQANTSINYYFHAGARFITKRFRDSMPTPMFFDTVGRITKVYGFGHFEDAGVFYVNNANDANDNWGFRGGRLIEMKKESSLILYASKIVVANHGIYTYGGIPISTTKYIPVFSSADSANRNYNFKSISIYADSIICGHGGTIANINWRNFRHLSDRFGKEKGTLYIKAKAFKSLSFGGWGGFEAFNNYNITFDVDNINGASWDVVDIKNSSILIKSENATNLVYWSVGNFSNTTWTTKCQNITTALNSNFLSYHCDLTRNFVFEYDIANLKQTAPIVPSYGYYRGFLQMPLASDTTNRFFIRNTNFIQMAAIANGAGGQAAIAIVDLGGNLGYDPNNKATSTPRLFLQNTTSCLRPGNNTAYNILFNGVANTRYSTLNISSTSLISNFGDIAPVANTSINYYIQPPIISSAWKTW
jgi:hypothetical protein